MLRGQDTGVGHDSYSLRNFLEVADQTSTSAEVERENTKDEIPEMGDLEDAIEEHRSSFADCHMSKEACKGLLLPSRYTRLAMDNWKSGEVTMHKGLL